MQFHQLVDRLPGRVVETGETFWLQKLRAIEVLAEKTSILVIDPRQTARHPFAD